MSTPMLIGAVAALLVVSLLVSAACYALMAKLFRAESPTFRRGLFVATLAFVGSAAMYALLEWSGNDIEKNPGLFLVATLSANLLVPIVVAARAFRTSLLRSTGIVVSAVVLGSGAAFVLALAVKATLFETFLIPTGSMAPTIRGAHMERNCRNCGRELIVGVTGDALQGPGEMRTRGIEVECVNCGQVNQVASDGNHPRGDRIVVDKLAGVERWDLVVFLKPGEPEQNYVKRFVGLPGEKLEWHAGELFADGELLRKPPGRMESLWFPVSDSAFVPKEQIRRTWMPDLFEATQWTRDGGRWLATANNNETARMKFAGNSDDAFEYNGNRRRNPKHVFDFKLRLTGMEIYSGELTVEWNWYGITIEFRLDSTGKLAIRQTRPQLHEIATGSVDLAAPQEESLELAVRDGQAYVRQGAALLATGAFGPKTLTDFLAVENEVDVVPWDTRPDHLSMAFRRGTISIGRIESFRDVYYLSPHEIQAGNEVRHIERDDAIALGEDEYLALGDNSDSALDSRFWGPVPRDNIIGVAKWQYWPSKRARELD